MGIEQKQFQRSRLPAEDEDDESGVYTTLSPAQTWSEQRIYYCCSNVAYNANNRSVLTQVTSLDDSIDQDRNPLYVNMSAVHPLAPNRINNPSQLHSAATQHIHPHRFFQPI